MYTYTTSIFLKDTDATGVLYFTEQMKLCLQAFETYLQESGFSLNHLIEQSPFLMPIVHAESDYFASFVVGDPVEITLTVSRIGTSSFTLSYILRSRGIEKGKATIVHVAVDKTNRSTIPLPKELTDLLQKIGE